ncbi:MAG: DUF1533 domain-containing protein [Paludibacter sp.]|nr:DUF1533 domain-containing protein [Paludibacter sp.]
MRKQFTRLLGVTLLLLLGVLQLNSQTTTVTWSLVSANTPSPSSGTGYTATAQNNTLTAPQTTDYTAKKLDGTVGAQRARGTYTSSSLPIVYDANSYLEYVLTAASGYNLTVSSVSMDVGQSGTTSVRAAFAYSTNNFTNSYWLGGYTSSAPIVSPALIRYDNAASAPYLKALSFTSFNGSSTVTIPEGSSLKVRVYPWLSAAATGKYIASSNVVFTFTVASSGATSPTLTAATAPTTDAPFDITFTDDATWRSAITGVTVGGTALTAGYTIDAGKITFTPSASIPAGLLQTAGTKTIAIQAATYANASVTQTIGAGTATKLVMKTQPTAPATNGAVLAAQPAVYIQDQYGNTTTNTDNVTATAVTSAGSWTLGGTNPVTATAGTATFSGLTAASYGAITGVSIDFTSGSLTHVTSNTFNLPVPAPPTITAAPSATVDAPFAVTFTDNPTWRAAISGITVGGTTLASGAYDITTAGQITFTPSVSTLLQTPGSKTIAITSTGYATDNFTQSVGVGAAAKLVVTTQPTSPASNGAVLATQPVVAIQDQYGNATTSTATIIASVGSGSWTIGGTTSVAATSGSTTFTDLTATSVAAVLSGTISFSSTGLTGTSSNTFSIPAPPGLPTPALSAAGGATVDASFEVTFTDDASWRAAITGITVGGVALSNSAYNTTTSGKITFIPSADVLLQSSGTKSIVISALGYDDAPVSQAIGAGTATKLVMKTQPTAPATNGAALDQQPAIYVQDQYSNVTSGTGSMTVSVTDPQGWLLGGTLSLDASSGTVTYSDITAGTTGKIAFNGATLTFTLNSLTVVSSSLNIPAYINLAGDHWKSKASASWNSASTWQSSPDGTTWYDNSTALVPGISAADVTIISPDAVTITSATTTNDINVNTGAKLSVNSGGTLTINSAKTLTVNGTLENGVKSASNPFSGTILVNGTFDLTAAPTASTASDATFIPTATWNTGSTCRISGIVGTLETDYTVLNGVNQAFYNFEVNTPNLIGKLGLQNVAVFGSANTFTVNSTGPGTGAAIKTGLQTSNSTTGRTGTSVTNYVQNAGTVHIVSNSSSTVGRSFTATGNFTLNGGTFNIAEYTGSSAVSTSLTIGGNLTVGSGAILQKDLTSALSADQGTVSLIFDGNTVLSNAGTIRDMDVIVVNGAKTLDFGTNIIGSIASSHNSNTVFSTNSGSIIKTAAAGGINSNITTGGIPTLNSATNYLFNAPDAQVSGSLLTSAGTITVSNSSGLTLSANTAAATLLNNSGSVLNVPVGKQLTVNTTLTNDGTINLLSDATGTATILTPATISGTGTTNVQQYLASGRNWYISSPVTGATSSAITGTTGNSLVSYNEVDGTWPSAGSTLNAGQGYIAVSPTSSAAVTFTGALNTGAQSYTLYRTDSAVVKRGFNLVGNPYPSYLNWESATRTNVGPTMWYRSKDAGVYVFATYGAVSQLGTSLGGTPVTKYIPPMQAFWVRVSGAGSGTLAFDNSMRSHSATTNLLKAPAATAATQQVLRLLVSNGTNSDEAIVFFNENAKNDFDEYDSPKMTNANVAIPEIYTIAGGEKLVINGLTSVSPNEELTLGFTTGQSNTFSIKATEFSNFSADTKVYLRDNLLNTEQELTTGAEYSFSSDIASTSTRFSVIFKSAGVTTGINNADIRNGIYKNANNQIVINCNTISADASVSVYNAIGQKVQTRRLTSTNTQIGTGLPSGVYMVTVNNAGKSVTAKVILN